MRAIILAPLMDGATALDPERRYASGGWITASNDPLRPNQIFQGRLLNRSFDVSVRLGTVFWGDQSQATYGALDLANNDRALDTLLALGVRNRRIEIRVGDAKDWWQDWRVEFVGIAESVDFPDSSCRITLADLSQSLDKPIMQGFYGAGALANKPYPLALGRPLNVPASLSDPSTLQYDCVDATGSVLRVRDQGDELSALSQWTPNGRGFRLLVSPVGRITADVEGPDSATSGTRTRTIEGFVEWVLEQFGISGIHPDIYSTLAGLACDLGYFTDAAVTGRQVMDALAASYGAGWVFDKLGRFNLLPLTLPSTTAVAIVTEAMVIGTVTARSDLARGFSPVVAALRNWYANTPTEIAGSLTSPTYQLIAQQLQQPYRNYVRAVPTVSLLPDWQTEIKEADVAKVTADLGIGTLLVDTTHAQTEADRWRDLYAERRWFYEVKVTSTAAILALELGDTIKLTVPQVGNGALAVRPFGLEGKNLVVVGYVRSGNDLETKLTLWGGAVAPGVIPPEPAMAIFICNFSGSNNSTVFIDEAEGNTITPYGDVKIQTAGGQHGLFDGGGDYLSVSRAAGWALGSEFTVEAIQSFDFPGFMTIASQFDNVGINRAWAFSTYGGYLYFSYSSSGGGFASILTAFTPTPGQQYHLVAEHDGTRFRLYINGATVYAAVVSLNIFAGSTQDLLIGRANGYSSDLAGKIFGIRISEFARYATDGFITVPSLPF